MFITLVQLRWNHFKQLFLEFLIVFVCAGWRMGLQKPTMEKHTEINYKPQERDDHWSEQHRDSTNSKKKDWIIVHYDASHYRLYRNQCVYVKTWMHRIDFYTLYKLYYFSRLSNRAFVNIHMYTVLMWSAIRWFINSHKFTSNTEEMFIFKLQTQPAHISPQNQDKKY